MSAGQAAAVELYSAWQSIHAVLLFRGKES